MYLLYQLLKEIGTPDNLKYVMEKDKSNYYGPGFGSKGNQRNQKLFKK